LGATAAGVEQLAEAGVVVEGGGGAEGVGEDAHAAAADEAVVPAVVVVEAEGQHLAAALALRAGQDAQGALLDLGLDAAAAEGAALAAVGEDEHGGAGLLRRRAARLDDRAVHALAPRAEGRRQFRKEVAHGGVPGRRLGAVSIPARRAPVVARSPDRATAAD